MPTSRRRSRSPASSAGGKVFLLEGDEVLALILSKAFLRAKDDELTDATIMAQIGR